MVLLIRMYSKACCGYGVVSDCVVAVVQVVHHVYLKPERLTKRSSPDDLQLKIKIIYDYSVDQ